MPRSDAVLVDDAPKGRAAAIPLDEEKKPPPPDVTGGAYTYDKNGGWLAALHNFAVGSNNVTRVLADAYTFGGLDAAQGQLPGSPSAADLRVQTNASREALGPYTAAALDAVGRTANPLSRVGGAGPLSLAASGAAQQGVSSALHGEDPVAGVAAGGITGGALGTVGKMMRPGLFPNVLHYVKEPAATALGSSLGGTPGALVGQAIAKAIPAPGPLGPAYPWAEKLFPALNPAAQGVLSGLLNNQ